MAVEPIFDIEFFNKTLKIGLNIRSQHTNPESQIIIETVIK